MEEKLTIEAKLDVIKWAAYMQDITESAYKLWARVPHTKTIKNILINICSETVFC
jgi:hypothetical protein